MFNLRFKDLFDAAGATVVPGYTLSQILLNIFVALFCGLAIYFIYKKTFSGVLFSSNLGVTMIIVCVITAMIVMAISGNLALSLGMIGALSIIRFRTPIKDPKDTAFLFWSITSGIIAGVSAYKLALVSVVTIGGCLIVLSKKITWTSPYLLVLNLRHPEDADLKKILKEHCSKFKERSSSIAAERTEVVYEVVLKKPATLDFLKRIQKAPGVQKAVMVSYEGELDETK